jgi:hypothetical protein
MDNITDKILRLASELTNFVYCMGYCGPSNSCSNWGVHIPTLWEEMVLGDRFQPNSSTDIIRRTLKRGKHRLLLWPDQEADGSVESSTPSKLGTRDEMGRLEKVCATAVARRFSHWCVVSSL